MVFIHGLINFCVCAASRSRGFQGFRSFRNRWPGMIRVIHNSTLDSADFCGCFPAMKSCYSSSLILALVNLINLETPSLATIHLSCGPASEHLLSTNYVDRLGCRCGARTPLHCSRTRLIKAINDPKYWLLIPNVLYLTF